MPVLVTSDLHLSDNPRDSYRHKFMRELLVIARQHKVDAVFILGDLTESKDQHRAELVNAVVGHLHALAQICPVIILQGNHDWLSSPDNPYFGFLELVGNITWVANPTPLGALESLSVKVKKVLGGTIFLPHSTNPQRDWSDIDFKRYARAFTHQTFVGAVGDNGRPLTGTPLSLFPPNLKVLSGDVHKPQRVGQVTYIGAPYHVDFGDSFEARVIVIEDSGKKHSISYAGPQKHLLQIGSVAELSKYKLIPGDVLKIRVETTPQQYAIWPEIVADVRNWGTENGYIVHTVQPQMMTTLVAAISKEPRTRKSDKEILLSYAGVRNVSNGTVKAGLGFL